MTKICPLHELRSLFDWYLEKSIDTYLVEHGHNGFVLCRAIDPIRDIAESNYYVADPDYPDETTATAEPTNCFGVPGMVVDVSEDRLYRGKRIKRSVDRLDLVKYELGQVQH